MFFLTRMHHKHVTWWSLRTNNCMIFSAAPPWGQTLHGLINTVFVHFHTDKTSPVSSLSLSQSVLFVVHRDTNGNQQQPKHFNLTSHSISGLLTSVPVRRRLHRVIRSLWKKLFMHLVPAVSYEFLQAAAVMKHSEDQMFALSSACSLHTLRLIANNHS